MSDNKWFWEPIWMLVTLPVFLLLVPVAAVVSLFDHRDVFSAAYHWTHGLLFGHRWRPENETVPKEWGWERCEFCEVIRVMGVCGRCQEKKVIVRQDAEGHRCRKCLAKEE